MFATPDPSRSSPLARNLRLLQIEVGPHNARVFNRPVISRLVQGSPTSTPVIPYAVSGVTPARAGFTAASRWGRRCGWDHPRSRGVYWSTPSSSSATGGSSPLARGLRSRGCSLPSNNRIIPARAGFTASSSSSVASVSDHPRSRGVYDIEALLTPRVAGSSPLARGLLVQQPLPESPGRIIPARAGFTMCPSVWECAPTDHPRSRGVYDDVFATQYEHVGIIPARAGFTEVPARRRCFHPDHPRSRGVYDLNAGNVVPLQGSSPLARGLLVPFLPGASRPRIIPARAGFTRTRASPPSTESDHPRSRGVYSPSA